jgi:para-aminobenzoate synthetase/4-amino-4-deoxychorismate lyase
MTLRIVMRDPSIAQWLVFSDAKHILLAKEPSDVLTVLREAEHFVDKDGLYAAGFVTYEAAAGFDDALITHRANELPLVCMGIFGEPEFKSEIEGIGETAVPAIDWRMAVSKSDYERKIHAVKRQIEAGNTYQINYTVRQHGSNIHDAWALFLQIAADAPYAAYIEYEDYKIVSASPELFFRLQGGQLTCKPMKGTSRRGLTSAEDGLLRDELQASVKNRAENVMILDMVRNDMGRIAEKGSVEVTEIYGIEKFPTVWQMTSTVSANTTAGVSEIFHALFPCASVTGAPKVSSTDIIAELENSPRDIYTGAIGYIGPDRSAQFNVAIRTALIDGTGQGVYGVGGGIVWDSDPLDEYLECLAKARVLSDSGPGRQFELLETILWSPPQGYSLLDKHLDRLCASAKYFDFPVSRLEVENALSISAMNFQKQKQRVRLTVARDGMLSVTNVELSESPDSNIQRIKLATNPVNSDSAFLYHKTTQRDAYESALESAAAADDVLLWNEEGYVTETSIANVAVNIDGSLCTPPVTCGLLAGTYRAWLLENELLVERPIHIEELIDGMQLLLFNSVRGQYSGTLQKISRSAQEKSGQK